MTTDRVAYGDSLDLVEENGREAVVTRTAIPRGTVVSRMRGELLDRPTSDSLQADHDLHLGPSGWLYDRMRHSCDANCFVDLSRRGDPQIRAARDLPAGAEVTLDYCTTEEELVAPFDCRCGAARCYGRVQGFRYLDPEQRAAVVEILAPHLRRIYTDQAPAMGTWVPPELVAGAA